VISGNHAQGVTHLVFDHAEIGLAIVDGHIPQRRLRVVFRNINGFGAMRYSFDSVPLAPVDGEEFI
jgi:hypothetical protein